MKKTYIQPCMFTIELKMQPILTGSITPSGDNLEVTIGDDSFGKGETINARGNDVDWDDEY